MIPIKLSKLFDGALEARWDKAFKESNVMYQLDGKTKVPVINILKFDASDKKAARLVVDRIIELYNVREGDCDSFMLCLMKYFLQYQKRYTTDKQQFGLEEYWQKPSLFYKNEFHGDCDDFSVFMKCCSIEFGVPDFRHKLVARTVLDNKGKVAGGHLNGIYLTYAENCWYTIESTYYLSTAIGNFHLIEDGHYKYYKGKEIIWFTFRQKKAYAQTDIIVKSRFWLDDKRKA